MSYDRKQLSTLLVQSQRGNKVAYRQFLLKISPIVNSVIRKKVFDLNNISDVSQEALLSIHKALATYDSKRDVIPWILAITERRIVDYIRKRKSAERLENLIEKNKDPDLTGDAVTFLRDAAKHIDEADKILAELPQETKRAILLTKVEGHSTKEAAKILKISESALRTRISRGLAQIRGRIKEDKE